MGKYMQIFQSLSKDMKSEIEHFGCAGWVQKSKRRIFFVPVNLY